MLNNLILVGRLAKDPEIRRVKDSYDVCTICLAVNRPYKDSTTGERGVDFINVSLWNGISKSTYEFTSKGDIVGIKGRVIDSIRVEDGINKHSLEVIGEKIVFISSVKPKDGLKYNPDMEFEENYDDDIPLDEIKDSK